ncbi:hypothetical protein ElyMa_004812200 [Elysia marginata]|uniref:Uncharacterized protein n=1 Tax=Elysia marginata TaxID=1093978 RepID=A0AAV4IEL9_9GAST|nr:hypothetical protein ElyMa_004812200 [Elysia marginata]
MWTYQRILRISWKDQMSNVDVLKMIHPKQTERWKSCLTLALQEDTIVSRSSYWREMLTDREAEDADESFIVEIVGMGIKAAETAMERERWRSMEDSWHPISSQR